MLVFVLSLVIAGGFESTEPHLDDVTDMMAARFRGETVSVKFYRRETARVGRDVTRIRGWQE